MSEIHVAGELVVDLDLFIREIQEGLLSSAKVSNLASPSGQDRLNLTDRSTVVFAILGQLIECFDLINLWQEVVRCPFIGKLSLKLSFIGPGALLFFLDGPLLGRRRRRRASFSRYFAWILCRV